MTNAKTFHLPNELLEEMEIQEMEMSSNKVIRLAIAFFEDACFYLVGFAHKGWTELVMATNDAEFAFDQFDRFCQAQTLDFGF